MDLCAPTAGSTDQRSCKRQTWCSRDLSTEVIIRFFSASSPLHPDSSSFCRLHEGHLRSFRPQSSLFRCRRCAFRTSCIKAYLQALYLFAAPCSACPKVRVSIPVVACCSYCRWCPCQCRRCHCLPTRHQRTDILVAVVVTSDRRYIFLDRPALAVAPLLRSTLS